MEHLLDIRRTVIDVAGSRGMPFVRKPGIEGVVFEPEGCPPGAKRHDCPDCFFCQQCSEVRCRACRSGAGRRGCGEERPPCSRERQCPTKR